MGKMLRKCVHIQIDKNTVKIHIVWEYVGVQRGKCQKLQNDKHAF